MMIKAKTASKSLLDYGKLHIYIINVERVQELLFYGRLKVGVMPNES